ncbi:hypothetical protein HDU76_000097 [Blyttiomyces sp. JEL0837]|nr:hypothetical protein HDU76_000097 [Blyttiomyces sp. JEL0837]
MMLDPVAQRQLAATVGFGIIAYKSHQAISHAFGLSNLTSNEILIWCFLDLIYILGLKYFRVPRLSYSWRITSLVLIALGCLNIGCIGGLNHFFGNEEFVSEGQGGVQSEGGFVKGEARIPSDLSNSTHIVGSHIVKVLPPTQIKLNPNGTHYCILPNTERAFIDIPVLIKGSPPWQIDYESVDSAGVVTRFENITVKPGPEGMSPGRLTTSSIRVDQPGIYAITSIRENIGGEGKVFKSFAEVVQCPEAKWFIENDPLGRTVDKCLDDSYEFAVDVAGTPPLLVAFAKDDTYHVLNTEDFRDDNAEAEQQLDVSEDGVPILASPITFRLKSSMKMESVGPHPFKLLYVTDGRNNTVMYTDLERQVPGLTNAIREPKVDRFFVDTHGQPTGRFQNCDSVKIKVGHKSQSSVNLHIHLDGEGPWTISYALAGSLEDMERKNYDDVKTIEAWESKVLEIPVQEAGVYALQSVSDRYCRGSVGLPDLCLVQQTFPPSIEIAAEPIEQICVGAIGASVNISLTGDAPFWIEYDEIYENQRTRQRNQILKLRDTLELKPSNPGTYVYEFKSVSDATYTEGIPIENMSITQIIHPQSEARFQKYDRIVRCPKDTVQLEILLSGIGPWTVSYEIMLESVKQKYVETGITESKLVIETPPLEVPGTYVVDLISVTDANGCSGKLDKSDVIIEVLAQRPTAQFTCSRPLMILEGGSGTLPVSFSGRQPFVINYVKQGDESQVETATFFKDNDKLKVNRPGVYEIVDFKDGICGGIVKSPTSCEVGLIPKPRLEIPSKEYSFVEGNVGIRGGVCEGTEDSMNLLMRGKTPFGVTYNVIKSAHGTADQVQNKELTSAVALARVKLETSDPGIYTYEFNTLSDGNYKNREKTSAGVLLRQEVWKKPTARFGDGKEKVSQCIGGEESIRIDLSGRPPFELTVELKPENQPRETIKLANITENVYYFRPPPLRTTGKYTLHLTELTDATGCRRSFEDIRKETSILVQVSDVAKISSLNFGSICVGDILTFPLQGTPPFTITYEFDGVEQPVLEVSDPLVTFNAEAPGLIRIISVCNQMQCCTRPQDLSHVVHELPSAYVDGGYDMIDDIREGDVSRIAVELKGVPPFRFTYSRTSLENNKGHPEESLTISDIESNYHVIETSLEGQFKVTSVYDKHCSYPRLKKTMPSTNAALRKAVSDQGEQKM